MQQIWLQLKFISIDNCSMRYRTFSSHKMVTSGPDVAVLSRLTIAHSFTFEYFIHQLWNLHIEGFIYKVSIYVNMYLTDFPTLSYTSTCEIPTLSYSRRLKKVSLLSRASPYRPLLGIQPPPPHPGVYMGIGKLSQYTRGSG